MAMEYDDLLRNYIGEFGFYQKIIYFLICLVSVPAAFNTMSTVFIVGVPDHWCNTPSLDPNLNLTRDMRLNLTVPMVEKDGEMIYSSCEMYDRDYTNWTLDDVYQALYIPENVSDTRIACRDGWIYDQSLYHSTAATDFDFVCDQKWLQSTSFAIYMSGKMVGAIVIGGISDLIGRQLTMCISILLMVIINIGIAFVPNYIGFLIMRFCVSMFSTAMYLCAFVMGIELVGPTWRVHVGSIIVYYWAVGYMVLAGIAYGLRDWRQLQLALAVPIASLLIFFFIIPESPRWLYTTNRKERADKVVRKIAKWNKTELPEKLDIIVKEAKRAYVWDILRTPRMRLRSFNVFFNWFVNTLVYYGLSLSTSDLGGNVYVNFFISGAVEIPAYMFTQIVPTYIGRRLSLIGTLILAGVALLLTLAVPSDMNTIVIVLAMIGKFSISASFAIIYIFTAEMYPTPIRNACVGAGSFFGRWGGIVAPYISQLSDYGKSIPIIIFGVLSLVAGVLSWFFPETKGKNLPETLEDGENFGKHDEEKDNKLDEVSEETKQTSNGISNGAYDGLEFYKF